MSLSEIQTERLVLRPLDRSDLDLIQAAAIQRDIADTMISIPFPFTRQAALHYVRFREAQMRRGRGLALTLFDAASRACYGLVEIRDIDPEHRQAELSFWLTSRARGQGFMAEALPALLDHAFGNLGLNRIYAHHMVRNPASGRVLAKLGFQQEGILRQQVRKWEIFEDVVIQARLQRDWLADRAYP